MKTSHMNHVCQEHCYTAQCGCLTAAELLDSFDADPVWWIQYIQQNASYCVIIIIHHVYMILLYIASIINN